MGNSTFRSNSLLGTLFFAKIIYGELLQLKFLIRQLFCDALIFGELCSEVSSLLL
jgi:hypothetical protein